MSRTHASLEPSRAGRAIAAAALIVLAGPAARAAPPEPSTNEPDAGYVTFARWDNDAAFSGLYTYSDSDRYYSAGARLGRFATDLRPVSEAARPLAAGARLVGADRVGWGATPLAIDLYTPGDITRSDVILDDRPYAGWLRAAGEVRLAWDGRYPRRGRLALSLGTVGPASLGEQVQTEVHQLARSDADDSADPYTIPAPDPMGWAHQVGSNGSLVVPQLTAGVEQQVLEWRRGRMALSLWCHGAVELGRAEGSASAGGTVRAGLMGARFADRTSGWELLLFGRAEGRGVAWNLFLDGGGGSHGVERVPFVLATEWGASARRGRVFLNWSAFSWSREERSPPAPVGYWTHLAGRSRWFEHRFGRIEIGWLL